MTRTRVFFLALFAALALSRLCHTGILWEGDALPLATAAQMLDGKTVYRDVWYDKPPLVPAFYLLSAARDGWPLRVEGALFALLCCWLAWRFARDLWSRREGLWAAGLMGFFLIFYLPSAVIPVGSDLLMLAPHLGAVWMAHRRRAFWSGALAGLAFWASPKALFVAAACVLWNPAGLPAIAAGFAAVLAAGTGWLWAAGALTAYWREVWVWGRLYAGDTFLAHPFREGLIRTLNWMGFHAALVLAAAAFLWKARRDEEKSSALRWAGWVLLAIAGAAAGMRFFPRYYFLLLPPAVLMASRGMTALGRMRAAALLLLAVPLVRFGPSYVTALTDPEWRDTMMDRDSRAAAARIRRAARPADTLFVWGYRPELFVYTRMPSATVFLDSQPLTGVPADRHLTNSEPVETMEARRHRLELARSAPTFIADGLSPYNPGLAITQYPELREWFGAYEEIGRSAQTVIYRRR